MLDVRGVIDRRILVNYRVRPDALEDVLPAPFEPMTVDGWGVGGICLIRLRDVRPRTLPAAVGVGSENAAHRIAVTWEAEGERNTGVYVPRRDTSSRLNAAFGGYLFGGGYGRARFDIAESNDQYSVEMESVDGTARVSVDGSVAERLPDDSVFESLDDASGFFRQGSTGYAPADDAQEAATYRGVELVTDEWRVEPLAIDAAASSYFESTDRFPQEAVSFDCALLMRDISHEWRRRESLCAPTDESATGTSVGASVGG